MNYVLTTLLLKYKHHHSKSLNGNAQCDTQCIKETKSLCIVVVKKGLPGDVIPSENLECLAVAQGKRGGDGSPSFIPYPQCLVNLPACQDYASEETVLTPILDRCWIEEITLPRDNDVPMIMLHAERPREHQFKEPLQPWGNTMPIFQSELYQADARIHIPCNAWMSKDIPRKSYCRSDTV